MDQRLNVGSPFDNLPVINYVNPNPIRVPNLVLIPDMIRIPPFTFICLQQQHGSCDGQRQRGTAYSSLTRNKSGRQRSRCERPITTALLSHKISTVTVVASPGRLSNIATRLNVLSDPNELIAGFVLTGTAPKRVLIRAIGPSLRSSAYRQSVGGSHLGIARPNSQHASRHEQRLGRRRDAPADYGFRPCAKVNRAKPQSSRRLPANNTAYSAIVRGFQRQRYWARRSLRSR